jgi:pantetheine-phosphate adenylyltransferase
MRRRFMKRGIYPGTFDPITNGHLDLVQRGLRIFEEIIIAVAPSPKKQPLFTLEERLELIKEAVKDYENVRVEAFNGLLVDYVKARRGVAIIRGLRAVSDFEYELQIALMNRRLDMEIETVFMMPSEEYSFLTSTIVKEVASFGGSVRGLVPGAVEKTLIDKFRIIEDIVE